MPSSLPVKPSLFSFGLFLIACGGPAAQDPKDDASVILPADSGSVAPVEAGTLADARVVTSSPDATPEAAPAPVVEAGNPGNPYGPDSSATCHQGADCTGTPVGLCEPCGWKCSATTHTCEPG